MKARYIDLPSEKLPHAIYSPEYWDAADRGRQIEIDPHVLPNRSRYCAEPTFQILSHVGMTLPEGCDFWMTCACLIELDESVFDVEVSEVAQGLLAHCGLTES